MARKTVIWVLFAAAALLSLLTLATAAAGFWVHRGWADGDRAIYQDGAAAAAAGNLGRTFQSMRSSMRDLIIETDPVENAKYKGDLDAGRARLLQMLGMLHDSAKGRPYTEKLANDVDDCMKEYFVVVDRMTDLAMRNRNAEAMQYLRNDAVPASRAFAAALTALMDAKNAQAELTFNENRRAADTGDALLAVNVVSAALLALASLAVCLLAATGAGRR
jgi:methyl-accepting chemotaxis protein